jgi:outer membrane biosynthesis protein TonB
MKNKNKSKGHKKWIFYLILGGFIIQLFRLLFKKGRIRDIGDNLKDFARQEKKEVTELTGGKESFKKFCHDSGSIFKDFFIPHDGNDNKPKILQAKSLATIVIVLFALKIAVTGYLFFIYPDQAKMVQQMTTEILKLTNQDRLDSNLVPLSLNSVLSASALAKAENMVMNDYFAHHSPDGKKPWDWISRDKYAYLFVGENLAMNFSSAQSAHQALMQSPSHQKNIMNAKYSDVGLAVVSGEINGQRTNVLVELFACQYQPKVAIAAQTDQTAGTTEEQVSEPKEEPTKVLATENIKTESKTETKSEQLPVEPKQPELSETEDVTPGPESKQESEAQEPKVAILSDFNIKDSAKTNAGTIYSPNKEIEHNPNTKIIHYASTNNEKIGLAARLITWSKYFYIGVLALMIIALIVNIAIRITIQHKPVIIETLVVILFIAGLLTVRLHILEHIAEKVAII